MKLLTIALFAFSLSAISSCDTEDDINITYKDAERYYYMDAAFDRRNTRQVERYIRMQIGKESNVPFVNGLTDTRVRLADNTNFYLRKKPGHILIKLDKQQNTKEAYHRVKSMCEGMKTIMMQ